MRKVEKFCDTFRQNRTSQNPTRFFLSGTKSNKWLAKSQFPEAKDLNECFHSEITKVRKWTKTHPRISRFFWIWILCFVFCPNFGALGTDGSWTKRVTKTAKKSLESWIIPFSCSNKPEHATWAGKNQERQVGPSGETPWTRQKVANRFWRPKAGVIKGNKVSRSCCQACCTIQRPPLLPESIVSNDD